MKQSFSLKRLLPLAMLLGLWLFASSPQIAAAEGAAPDGITPAATFDIPCGDETALQNAINSANANPDLDFINLNSDNFELCIYQPTFVMAFTEDATVNGNGSIVNAISSGDDGIQVSGSGVSVAFDSINVLNAPDDGLYVYNSGTADLYSSTFAFSGGEGIFATGNATVEMINTTISGNGTSGLYASGGASAFVAFSTIANNAGHGIEVNTGSRVDVRASLIANHQGDCQNNGTLNDDGFNYDTDGTCGSAMTAATIIEEDLRDNGGPALTHLPVFTDNASTACTYDSNMNDLYDAVNMQDARYADRPFDFDGANGSECDSGAVEMYPVTYIVNDTGNDFDATSSDGLCKTLSGNCTLNAAIMEANYQPDANVIVLAPGQTHAPNGIGYNVQGDLYIRGNGAVINATGTTNNDGMQHQEGTLFIDGLTIMNATDGGLFMASDTRAVLVNSLLYGNQYGIWQSGFDTQLEVTNSTIVKNSANGILSAKNATISNSLIGFNTFSDINAADVNTITISHSAIEDGLPDPVTNGGGNINADPMFVDEPNNDFRLMAGSPAINAGTLAFFPFDRTDRDNDNNIDEYLPLDLDNNPRIDGGLPDMGAYEADSDPFVDVPGDLPAPFMEPWVEYFLQTGITGGKPNCVNTSPGPGLTFCPEDKVTRGEMAVFIVRAMEYPNLPYSPPGDPGDPFVDVFKGSLDLPAPFMEDWIEEFYAREITGGKPNCVNTSPGPGLTFCPKDTVTRGEMAVFILRALEYPNLPYSPTGDPSDPFADVFTGSTALPAPFMEDWIEEFYAREITGGKINCENSANAGVGEIVYCPSDEVTRAEMAVFILRAFDAIPDPSD